MWLALHNVTGCTKVSGFMLEMLQNATSAPGRRNDKALNISIHIFILGPQPEL